MTPEAKLEALGLTLPPVSAPIGSYVTCKRQGNLLYLSGAGPIVQGEVLYKGKVGAEITPDVAYEAAKVSALNLIAALKAELGDLSKVKSIVKLLGLVACADGFVEDRGERGVGVAEPTAVCNTVCHVGELIGRVNVEIVENGLGENIRVEL